MIIISSHKKQLNIFKKNFMKKIMQIKKLFALQYTFIFLYYINTVDDHKVYKLFKFFMRLLTPKNFFSTLLSEIS